MSTLTVQGHADGVAYTAVLTDGVLQTSPRVHALLEAREDTSVSQPVGPDLTVSATDSVGVLAGLHAFTEVTDVGGDVPTAWLEATEDMPGVTH